MSTEGSLLSLERTRTTICHRDITFTNVPGLQFVVSREPRYPDGVTNIRPHLVPHRARTYSFQPAGAKARSSMHDLAGRAPSQSPQDNIVVIDEVERPTASGRTHSRRHSSRAGTYYAEDDLPPPHGHRGDAVESSGLEDQGFSDIEAEQDSTSLPE